MKAKLVNESFDENIYNKINTYENGKYIYEIIGNFLIDYNLINSQMSQDELIAEISKALKANFKGNMRKVSYYLNVDEDFIPDALSYIYDELNFRNANNSKYEEWERNQ